MKREEYRRRYDPENDATMTDRERREYEAQEHRKRDQKKRELRIRRIVREKKQRGYL